MVLGQALGDTVGETEGGIVEEPLGTREGLDVTSTLGTTVGRWVGFMVGL